MEDSPTKDALIVTATRMPTAVSYNTMINEENIPEEYKVQCEKIVDAINSVITMEPIERNNNLFSRINEGMNKIRKVLDQQYVRSLITEPFCDPKFFKFYRFFMLDQDRKIREYAFEMLQKILLIGEEVAEAAKREKIHVVLGYSLGRDCKSPTLIDERTQILKCIQVWITKYPKTFPFILAQSLVSICKNFEDNLRKRSIDILIEISAK